MKIWWRKNSMLWSLAITVSWSFDLSCNATKNIAMASKYFIINCNLGRQNFRFQKFYLNWSQRQKLTVIFKSKFIMYNWSHFERDVSSHWSIYLNIPVLPLLALYLKSSSLISIIVSINKLKRTNNVIVKWYSMTNSNQWGSYKKVYIHS